MYIKIFIIIMLCNCLSLGIGIVLINYIQYKKVNKMWEKELEENKLFDILKN